MAGKLGFVCDSGSSKFPRTVLPTAPARLNQPIRYSVSPKRSWQLLNDHTVALLGTTLMVLGCVIEVAALLGPYWYSWTWLDVLNRTMTVREGLWVLCPQWPNATCVSKEGAGDEIRTLAVWMMTISVMMSIVATIFACAFLFSLYRMKKCVWAKITTSAVFGLFSGFTSLVSVICMAVHKLTTESTGKDGVITISYGWSFVLSACQLPFIFAATTLFLIGGRTGTDIGGAQSKEGEQAVTVLVNADVAPEEPVIAVNPDDAHV